MLSYDSDMLLAARKTTPSHPTFDDILDARTNVVRMPRRLDPSMTARLQALVRDARFHHEVALDTSAPEVGGLLTSITDAEVSRFLADDIRQLVQQWGQTLGHKHVHATLFVQRTDGCPKIHADAVTIRLLCTYTGPGTEWLPNAELVRKNLARTDVDLATANASVIRKGGALRRCDPGDVLLLKGNGYPGNAGRGAAHRSPPLGASGVARLVLKIDQNRCGC